MKPADIKQGKSYIDHQGRIYDVRIISKGRIYTLVYFDRRAPDEGKGSWKVEEFAAYMKGEYKE